MNGTTLCPENKYDSSNTHKRIRVVIDGALRVVVVVAVVFVVGVAVAVGVVVAVAVGVELI